MCPGITWIKVLIMSDRKVCLACGDSLRGRIDKKYCNDYCRARYNNDQRVRTSQSTVIKEINRILLRNRSILETLLSTNVISKKISREILLQMDFNFEYFTHHKQVVWHYCYEFGYQCIGDDWFLLVRDSRESTPMESLTGSNN